MYTGQVSFLRLMDRIEWFAGIFGEGCGIGEYVCPVCGSHVTRAGYAQSLLLTLIYKPPSDHKYGSPPPLSPPRGREGLNLVGAKKAHCSGVLGAMDVLFMYDTFKQGVCSNFGFSEEWKNLKA